MSAVIAASQSMAAIGVPALRLRRGRQHRHRRAGHLTEKEDDAFWTWAVIETLRHTVRIEELLEITQLAVVSYRLPATGETIPLLQIVPSKTDEERLLLVSPELASVLATFIKRLRGDNNGSIRMVARYDPHEKTSGPPLP